MKSYAVTLSTLVCGEIESPTEAVTRFCLEMGIKPEIRDTLCFDVHDADTGEKVTVDMTEESNG